MKKIVLSQLLTTAISLGSFLLVFSIFNGWLESGENRFVVTAQAVIAAIAIVGIAGIGAVSVIVSTTIVIITFFIVIITAGIDAGLITGALGISIMACLLSNNLVRSNTIPRKCLVASYGLQSLIIFGFINAVAFI